MSGRNDTRPLYPGPDNLQNGCFDPDNRYIGPWNPYYELTATDFYEAIESDHASFICDVLDYYGIGGDDCLDEEQYLLLNDLLSLAAAFAYREQLSPEMTGMLIRSVAPYIYAPHVFWTIASALNVWTCQYEDIPKDLKKSLHDGTDYPEIAELIGACTAGELLSTMCYLTDQVTDFAIDYAGELLVAACQSGLIGTDFVLAQMAAALDLSADAATDDDDDDDE